MDPNNIQPPNHLITFKTWVDNTTPVTTAHHVEIQVTSFSSARFLATSSLISTTKDCTDLCCSKSCKHWEAEEISNGFIPMQCFYEVHPNIAKVFIEQLVLKTYYSSPTFISGKFTILWTYFSHRVIKLHKKAAFYILNSVNPDGALIYPEAMLAATHTKFPHHPWQVTVRPTRPQRYHLGFILNNCLLIGFEKKHKKYTHTNWHP